MSSPAKIAANRRNAQRSTGPRSAFECPETGKVVKFLYLIPGGRRFRSRHALRLTYRVNNLTRSERYFERAERLMKRLGGTSIREKPLRPKHMRRSTYEFLWDDITQAYLLSMLAFFGWSMADIRYDEESKEFVLPPIGKNKRNQ